MSLTSTYLATSGPMLGAQGDTITGPEAQAAINKIMIFIIVFLILDLIFIVYAIHCLISCVHAKLIPTWALVVLILLFFVPGLGFIICIGVIVYFHSVCKYAGTPGAPMSAFRF